MSIVTITNLRIIYRKVRSRFSLSNGHGKWTDMVSTYPNGKWCEECKHSCFNAGRIQVKVLITKVIPCVLCSVTTVNLKVTTHHHGTAGAVLCPRIANTITHNSCSWGPFDAIIELTVYYALYSMELVTCKLLIHSQVYEL